MSEGWSRRACMCVRTSLCCSGGRGSFCWVSLPPEEKNKTSTYTITLCVLYTPYANKDCKPQTALFSYSLVWSNLSCTNSLLWLGVSAGALSPASLPGLTRSHSRQAAVFTPGRLPLMMSSACLSLCPHSHMRLQL